VKLKATGNKQQAGCIKTVCRPTINSTKQYGPMLSFLLVTGGQTTASTTAAGVKPDSTSSKIPAATTMAGN
jgi:hypothetical protein